MNKNREIIYKRRQKLLDKIAETEKPDDSVRSKQDEGESLEASGLHREIISLLEQEAHQIVFSHAPDEDPESWNIAEMRETLAALHPILRDAVAHALKQKREDAERAVAKALVELYEKKCAMEAPPVVLQAERIVSLRSIDTLWMEHIDDMAHLREQVAFSGYAQRDPRVEYQDQGFRRFHQLILNINAAVVRTLIQSDLKQFTPRLIEEAEEELEGAQTNEGEIEGQLAETGVSKDVIRMPAHAEVPRYKMQDTKKSQDSQSVKIGRNDPCPCGSGKKYKKCHGKDF
jgi:preprotein translocase subunit SecA